MLEYDFWSKNPRWVCEFLPKSSKENNVVDVSKRPAFKPDKDLPQPFRTKSEDFTNSGFDRGHLAAAANYKHSAADFEASFLLSNISPQVGVGFNRDYWRRLEDCRLSREDSS